MIRRLFLVGIMVLVRRGSMTQLIIGTVFSIVFLYAMHTRAAFKRRLLCPSLATGAFQRASRVPSVRSLLQLLVNPYEHTDDKCAAGRALKPPLKIHALRFC